MKVTGHIHECNSLIVFSYDEAMQSSETETIHICWNKFGKFVKIQGNIFFWRVLAIRSQCALLPPAINPCRARAFAQAGVWHGDIAHKIESPFCSTAACRLSACLPTWWSCYPSMALAATAVCCQLRRLLRTQLSQWSNLEEFVHKSEMEKYFWIKLIELIFVN